jgi:hypothetical protein
LDGGFRPQSGRTKLFHYGLLRAHTGHSAPPFPRVFRKT